VNEVSRLARPKQKPGLKRNRPFAKLYQLGELRVGNYTRDEAQATSLAVFVTAAIQMRAVK